MSSHGVREDFDSDDGIMGLVKRRKFYTIPKAQQKIFDRGNSAYHSLQKQSNGIRGNIPEVVLEGLSAQYRRKKDIQKSKASEKRSEVLSSVEVGTGDHSKANGGALASTSRSQHDKTQSSNPQNLQSPLPSSSPGRPLSWSPSPTSQRHRSGVLNVSGTVEETPSAQRVVQGGHPRSATKLLAKIDYNNFPSSDGSEDELEVDIPDAQETTLPTINPPGTHFGRLASSPLKHTSIMENTPPCAQPPTIIPSTITQGAKATVQGSAPKRKRRWMPIPSFSDEAVQERPEKVRVRMPNTKLFEIESSNSTNSSMVVPATPEPPHGESLNRSPRAAAHPHKAEDTLSDPAQGKPGSSPRVQQDADRERSEMTSRASSNGPPSSGLSSVRRTGSLAKPRLTGILYLQSLKKKPGRDEAREARMRELGRAKRLSRGETVTSSRASSKSD